MMRDDSTMRFSPILDDDHAGNVWIMTILAVLYSLLTAVVRALIKKRAFGMEDVFFYVALVSQSYFLSTQYLPRYVNIWQTYSH